MGPLVLEEDITDREGIADWSCHTHTHTHTRTHTHTARATNGL